MEVPPFNLLHTRKMNFGFLATPSLRWIDPSGDYWMCRERVALAEVSCCAWKAAVFDHYNVIYFLLQSEGWNPHDYSCISNPLRKQVGSTYISTNWSTVGPKRKWRCINYLFMTWAELKLVFWVQECSATLIIRLAIRYQLISCKLSAILQSVDW